MMQLKVHGFIIIVLMCCIVALAGRKARASDPSLGRYSDDPSNVLWFIQISDAHIDTTFSASEELKLEWSLTQAVDVIDPLFVTLTGDITDSTNGVIYGFGPYNEEWEKYRNIVDSADMTADFCYDLPGNHDAYGDENASYYLEWSVQGSTQDTTQPHWRFDLPFGSYHFVGVATPCNDWLQWPFDNTEISDDEVAELQANLEANADSTLTIAMGHHEYEIAAGGGDLDELFAAYGVPYYIHGHKHDYRAKVSTNGIVVQRIDSLGQSEGNNFCVHALDNNCISHSCVKATDAWPMVVITAPVDARLDNDDNVENPYARSVPTTCTEAPVRALVFDSVFIGTVTYWWDTGAAGPMYESDEIPAQFAGTFDATPFSPGVHTLNIEAIGSSTRDYTIQVLFEDRPCDVSEDPHPDDDMEDAAEDVAEEAEEDFEAEPETPPETQPDAMQDPSTPDVDVDAGHDAEEETDDFDIGGEISGGGCSCKVSR
ncbi:MAG: metallophosphoesterase [Pseudomonadota bacterium]